MTNKPHPQQHTAWDLYRASLLRTQLSIIFICVVVYFVVRPGVVPVLVMFVAMQVVAYLGVWWGLKAARRVSEREDRLPLEDDRR